MGGKRGSMGVTMVSKNGKLSSNKRNDDKKHKYLEV